MNELITRCIEDFNIAPLADIPTDLLTEQELDIVSFIFDYGRRHKKPPSIKKIMKNFELFVPYVFASTRFEPTAPPLSEVLERTIKNKLATFTESKLRSVNAIIRESGEVPLDELDEIKRVHTMALGIISYSTFDRELYFRRSSLNIPFSLLNRNIGGLANGDFMLIAGRLGAGKSTVAQFIAKEVWLTGKRILFISAEMLSTDVFSRIDAMIGKFNPLDLRKGRTDDMQRKLIQVTKDVSGKSGEIIIPRSRLLSPTQISAFASNLNIDLIIVDGAYLLTPSVKGLTSKWEKVAAVSNELKQIALALDIPIIGTTQLKRGSSGAVGITPEDLSYSDALGQDADFIIAVFQNPTIKGRTELELIKNRYGSLCATRIFIDFDTMTITDETILGAVDEGEEMWDEWVRKVKKDRGLE